MNALLRSLHVWAVALWLGSVVFFTIAGLLIFRAFEAESRLPADERPVWLPVPPAYARPSPGPGFPDPMRLEQGSRAAGVAVSRIFPVYYGLQVGCGVVALLTALLLPRGAEGGAYQWRMALALLALLTGHPESEEQKEQGQLRIALALLALLTALGGWWLEGEVSRLREPRNRLTDEVLTMTAPSVEMVEEARQARATFGTWHGYSLIQNFTTLFLVAGLTRLVLPLCRGPNRE
jgi:Domain of unknown function (DUF4149)